MAKSILERLWKDQKSSVEELLQDIQDNYSEETGITDREYQIEKLKRESERLKNRMSNLVDMKLDDLIGSEEFEDKGIECKVYYSRLSEYQEKLRYSSALFRTALSKR